MQIKCPTLMGFWIFFLITQRHFGLFRRGPSKISFLQREYMALNVAVFCVPVNLLIILQHRDEETELLGGKNGESEKLIRYFKSPSKMCFQFISPPTVCKSTPFALLQETCCSQSSYTFCQSPVWKWCLVTILACLPVRAVRLHIFSDGLFVFPLPITFS